ncbi:hypothetical protein KL939_000007 [Ogataea angusta]|nr:hypothetical protein KL939_000007 [Ogataea angusta]
MLSRNSILSLYLSLASSIAAPVSDTVSSSLNSTSLTEMCDSSYIQSLIPSNGTLLGIDLIPSSVQATIVDPSAQGSSSSGASSTSTYTSKYCSVTLEYTHTGKGDNVTVKYAFPSPDEFSNRFYLAGGGGYTLNSDATGGLTYGAVSGATSAGYDAFDYSMDEVFLYGNGSINWDAAYMFSYQALGELTVVGKYLTREFYGLAQEEKLYTYFEGCSDGGREAMSQVQRWGEEYDGVIAGAPAFRYAQQQVLHVFPATVEHTLGYYPPTCELEKIVNATIEACDGLDGRVDGVISRTDLCALQFDLESLVGQPYYCAATTSSSLGFGFSKRDDQSQTSDTPEQSGNITKEGIAVAKQIYDGLFNSDGERAYLSFRIGSSLDDADTTYNSDDDKWELNIPSTGGLYVQKFIKLLDLDNLDNLDGVTYDTLIDWMKIGMYRYFDSLQTTVTDLTPFRNAGGKLIHYHGESDPSIPPASSVHYWQSVRDTLYGNLTFEESLKELDDWYQFYLVPGAAHCGTNELQPGPYPETNMEIMINWVENGVKPTGLNATVSEGEYASENQELCKWPTRPLWRSGNLSTFDCVFDQASYESWTYEFPAFKIPVY